MKTKEEIQVEVASNTKKFLENNKKLRKQHYKTTLFIFLGSFCFVVIMTQCNLIFLNVEYLHILGFKVYFDFQYVMMGLFTGGILLFIKDLIWKPMSSIIVEFPDETIIATPKNEKKGIDVIRRIFEIIDQTGISNYKINVKNDEICE